MSCGRPTVRKTSSDSFVYIQFISGMVLPQLFGVLLRPFSFWTLFYTTDNSITSLPVYRSIYLRDPVTPHVFCTHSDTPSPPQLFVVPWPRISIYNREFRTFTLIKRSVYIYTFLLVPLNPFYSPIRLYRPSIPTLTLFALSSFELLYSFPVRGPGMFQEV